ncbi:hypothetical protein QTP70_028239, partial [Hemibagrus guttatus]
GKMGKRKDLSEFDKGQIVMARRLDQSISKTAALVGCSQSVVVSIYQKWSKNWTREQWKKVAWSDETCFLFHHMDGRVCVHRLPGEHMAPGCTMGRRQAGGGSVMLWAMFCWETLGPADHVDVTLTCTTYLCIVVEHVYPFMETVFPDGCGVFQQDNVACPKAKIIQEWFDECNNQFEVLTWPPNSPDFNPIKHLWDVLNKQV